MRCALSNLTPFSNSRGQVLSFLRHHNFRNKIPYNLVNLETYKFFPRLFIIFIKTYENINNLRKKLKMNAN